MIGILSEKLYSKEMILNSGPNNIRSSQ